MKECTYPGCEKLCEGKTDFCASHNRELRKQRNALDRSTTKRKNDEYGKKVKKWKVGKRCALSYRSSEKCYGPITCHHKRGRTGQLLMDERYWLPVCLGHHQYIEMHPEEAYRNGWSELRLAKEPLPFNLSTHITTPFN